MKTSSYLVSSCIVAFCLAMQTSAKAESAGGVSATPPQPQPTPVAADLETVEGVAKWLAFVTKEIGSLEKRVAQPTFPAVAKDAAQKLLSDMNKMKSDLAAIPANTVLTADQITKLKADHQAVVADRQALKAVAPAEAVTPTALKKVVVSASVEMDAKRDMIAPALGATTYTLGPTQIQTTGQGENAPFQQQLLHAPGVVQDEFGQEHVRGEHANLQYRINGVLLPDQLNGFGQEIDTRLIKSVSLITGTLPAQFGDRTAGIVDVTTKTGSQLEGGELSMYGGSYGTYQPSLSYGGTKGNFEYYFSTSFKQNDVGIENTTASPHPIHDVTDQERAFGYFSNRLDDTSRISLILSASNADFQIPDNPALAAVFSSAGNPPAKVTSVNENQNEQNYYSALSYLKTDDKFSLQLSPFISSSGIRFTPDPVQDLLFNGIAGKVGNSDLAIGFQADTSFELNDSHTLRGGMTTTYDNEKLITNSSVFPAAGQFYPDGSNPVQTSNVPFQIANNSGNSGWTTGLYVQDEWKMIHDVTLNYGLRYDRFDVNFDHEDQVSPRLNLVWNIDKATTFHAGYARYFTPPTLQHISPAVVTSFEYTSNAPLNARDDSQKCERANYFDAGLSRQITKPWQVTADSFCKLAKNLIDNGQFGNAVILNDFNYRTGTVYGAELSTNYKKGPFSLYGNFSYVHTAGRDIESAQFEFASKELAYIATHDIHLDHDQQYTGSAGCSYTYQKDTRFYTDILYGNGLRAGFANLDKLPAYQPVNVGVEHAFHLASGREVKLRFDCLNVFDEVYELRNGSGLGIAAPAYGQRRGFYGGVSFKW